MAAKQAKSVAPFDFEGNTNDSDYFWWNGSKQKSSIMPSNGVKPNLVKWKHCTWSNKTSNYFQNAEFQLLIQFRPRPVNGSIRGELEFKLCNMTKIMADNELNFEISLHVESDKKWKAPSEQGLQNFDVNLTKVGVLRASHNPKSRSKIRVKNQGPK
jgi:hypothetical protein